MPKRSPAHNQARKDEIIAACEKLYKTMSFKEITIKEIGNITSFTRTSIYNYFQTKEEIFLALLQKEYLLWIESLKNLREKNKIMDKLEFASALAHSLEERKNLLKLLSMNHYDMEENSRLERLIEFKTVYNQALSELHNCLRYFFPDMSEEDNKNFIFSFLPFMFGIYPYTVVTEKQKEAMYKAKVNFIFMSVYDITYMEIKKLLGV